MDTNMIGILDDMREQAGFKYPIRSGYRCPEHNERVSSTGLTGPHTTGKAVDIGVRGQEAHEVVRLAFELGFSGIGVSQKGNMHKRFIHIDMLNTPGRFRPTVWSY
jgi:uncharacterized protein YcbK (DUF882 family)